MEEVLAPDPDFDPRILEMAKKVLEETILIEGDGTLEWAAKGVRAVVRTAKKFGCYDLFYESVMREESSSKCCPAHNEKLPLGFGRAVNFALKLFRFPYARFETQVKSTLGCRHPFEPPFRQVCLNPWHYRWIELPRVPVPPIVVNKDLDYGEPPVRTENLFESAVDSDEGLTEEEIIAKYAVPNVTMKGDEIKILYERHAAAGGMFTYPLYSGLNGMYDGASTSSTMSLTPSLMSAFQHRLRDNEEEAMYYRSGLSSPASDIASPNIFIPQPGDPDNLSLDQEMMGADDFEDDEEMRAMNQRSTYPDGRPMTPLEPRPLFRSSASELAELARNATYECVEYEENPNWLSLMYYEEGVQVGEGKTFQGHHCLIDGFTATETQAPNRFSIGFYSNPSRHPTTSEVRALIGRGVRLYLLAGEVYVENLCNISVFVQSISANMKNGFQLNTVSKLPPHATMKVFDMRQFSKQLAAAAEKTYQDVYALCRMCTVRISFCKGWGEHYRRSTVLRSPVWFQCHLHNPMLWIDSVLNCMGAPPRLCSSRT